MSCYYSELRNKEVICVQDGRRLGYVCDLEFDPVIGKICALIVPGTVSFFSFSKRGRCCIPWEHIVRIGDDIILVSGAFPLSPTNKK